MKLGASSACYYPMNTELALAHVLALGFQNTEIFFNTVSELNPTFVKQLGHMAAAQNAHIRAVHPFTSFAETTGLFSTYQRRFSDTVEFYKKYFQAARLLGANIVVIHGSKQPGLLSHEEYFERFGALAQAGNAAGVVVAQENVNGFLSQDLVFLKEMRAALGSCFHMVFDVKQAVRAGYEPLTFAKEMRDSICHIHISDHDAKLDCIPPGRGTFDFAQLERTMAQAAYQGAYMIEIYKNQYHVDRELAFAKAYLESI